MGWMECPGGGERLRLLVVTQCEGLGGGGVRAAAVAAGCLCPSTAPTAAGAAGWERGHGACGRKSHLVDAL